VTCFPLTAAVFWLAKRACETGTGRGNECKIWYEGTPISTLVGRL